MKIIYFLLETFLPYEILLSTIILLSACLLIILIFEEFARSLYRLSDQFFFRILACVTTECAAVLWYFWAKNFIQTRPQIKEYGNLPITVFIIISVNVMIMTGILTSLHIHNCRSEKHNRQK